MPALRAALLCGNQTHSAAESASYRPLLIQYTPALFAAHEMLFQEHGFTFVQPRE
jgi:hypothetical protein